MTDQLMNSYYQNSTLSVGKEHSDTASLQLDPIISFFTLLWFMAFTKALATLMSMDSSNTLTTSSVLLCFSALASALPAATSILSLQEVNCVKLLVAMALVRSQ